MTQILPVSSFSFIFYVCLERFYQTHHSFFFFDPLANGLEGILPERLRSWSCRSSLLETETIIGAMRKAMIGLMIIATIGPMIVATIDYYIEDLKTSRNGSLHEANVKESSYENFPLLWRMDRVNVYTELLELELDKPLAVKWKNSRKWPDTLPQVDKLLAHINGWPDLKPYNMFGTTAFRSQPHWGDHGGEKHILPGEDIMDEPCPLPEVAEANERFCCTIRRAPKSHPRAMRQLDLRSHGWQMNMYTLLIIKEITSSSILHETLVLVSLFCIFQITRLANELVKIVDKLLAKLWAHIGNGGTELKAYKKSRITHPGKHGHNVGSTAFRNCAQGGDGSDEELTIQDDWGSPSVQMTSPAPKTTPQTPPLPTPPPSQTPPSPTLRATPQVQPPTPASQVQPPTPTPQVQPPTPTPQVQPRTPTPAPPPPPPPRRWFNFNFGGWFHFNFGGWFNFNFGGWFNFNVTGLAKIFLTISATLVLAPPQIILSGGNSLSSNDKTLLFGTKLLGWGGFIFCLLAYIVGQDNTAAKLLIALGVLANVFGLLLLVALGK